MAFLVLSVASIMVTYIASTLVEVINTNGMVVGIEAYKGSTFMAMSWSATMLIPLTIFLRYHAIQAQKEKETTKELIHSIEIERASAKFIRPGSYNHNYSSEQSYQHSPNQRSSRGNKLKQPEIGIHKN
jgi:uncharacterized protein YuzE